jgi:hypothetical protein
VATIPDRYEYCFVDYFTDNQKAFVRTALTVVPDVIASFTELSGTCASSGIAIESWWRCNPGEYCYHVIYKAVLPFKMIFLDRALHDTNYGGLGFVAPSYNVTITLKQLDWDFGAHRLGVKIWHELLHVYGLPADNMTSNPGFDAWLMANYPSSVYAPFLSDKEKYKDDVYYTELYYIYLTSLKWGGEPPPPPPECYPDGKTRCYPAYGVSPYALQICRYGKWVTVLENSAQCGYEEPSAKFRMGPVTVTPATAEQGSSITISATVYNESDISDSVDVGFSIRPNSTTIIERKWVETPVISAWGSRTVSFPMNIDSKYSDGNYYACMEFAMADSDLTCQQFTVYTPIPPECQEGAKDCVEPYTLRECIDSKWKNVEYDSPACGWIPPPPVPEPINYWIVFGAVAVVVGTAGYLILHSQKIV